MLSRKMPRTSVAELGPFVESLSKVPKSGLHNAYKNPERYVQYGAISGRAAGMLADKDVRRRGFARTAHSSLTGTCARASSGGAPLCPLHTARDAQVVRGSHEVRYYCRCTRLPWGAAR